MNGFQKKIIEHALDESEKLTEWEYDFVNDIAGKSDDYEATKKQNEILNRISQKFT